MLHLAFLIMEIPDTPMFTIPFSARNKSRSLVQTLVKIPVCLMREHVAMRVVACCASTSQRRPKMVWRPAILTCMCEGLVLCCRRIPLVVRK